MDVRIKRMQPLLLRNLRDILRHHLIRMIVKQDIDSPHLAHRLFHNLLAIPLLLQIRRIQMTFPAVVLYELLRLLGIFLLLGQVCDEAVCALHGEEHGGRATYAGVAAGDEGFLVFELVGGLVELGAAIGGGDVVDFGGWA